MTGVLTCALPISQPIKQAGNLDLRFAVQDNHGLLLPVTQGAIRKTHSPVAASPIKHFTIERTWPHSIFRCINNLKPPNVVPSVVSQAWMQTSRRRVYPAEHLPPQRRDDLTYPSLR